MTLAQILESLNQARSEIRNSVFRMMIAMMNVTGDAVAKYAPLIVIASTVSILLSTVGLKKAVQDAATFLLRTYENGPRQFYSE